MMESGHLCWYQDQTVPCKEGGEREGEGEREGGVKGREGEGERDGGVKGMEG